MAPAMVRHQTAMPFRLSFRAVNLGTLLDWDLTFYIDNPINARMSSFLLYNSHKLIRIWNTNVSLVLKCSTGIDVDFDSD